MLVLPCAVELLGEDREDVVFAEEDEVLTVDLDLGARVLAEQDLVARLHVEGDDLAALDRLAGADGHDRPLERLLLGGVRDDDPPLRLLFFLSALDDEAILERSNFHLFFPLYAAQSRGLLAL